MTNLTNLTVPQIAVLAAVTSGCVTTSQIHDRIDNPLTPLHHVYRAHRLLCATKTKGRLTYRVSKRITAQLVSIIGAHLTLGTPEIIAALGF